MTFMLHKKKKQCVKSGQDDPNDHILHASNPHVLQPVWTERATEMLVIVTHSLSEKDRSIYLSFSPCVQFFPHTDINASLIFPKK